MNKCERPFCFILCCPVSYNSSCFPIHYHPHISACCFFYSKIGVQFEEMIGLIYSQRKHAFPSFSLAWNQFFVASNTDLEFCLWSNHICFSWNVFGVLLFADIMDGPFSIWMELLANMKLVCFTHFHEHSSSFLQIAFGIILHNVVVHPFSSMKM